MELIGAYNTTGQQPGSLMPDAILEQTFYSRLDALAAVEFNVATSPSQQAVLFLELVDESGAVIRTAEATVEVGSENQFVRLTFEPVLDSADTFYRARLYHGLLTSCDLAGGEDETCDLPLVSDQLSAFAYQLKVSKEDYYLNGELMVNGKAQSGDLVFRSYHQSQLSRSQATAQALQNHLRADPIFFGVYLVIVGVTLLGLIFGVWKAISNRK